MALISKVKDSCIPIYNSENAIISHAFIYEEPVKKDEKLSVPVLIMNYNDVKDIDKAYLEFPLSDKDGYHRLEFDKKFVESSHLINTDYVVYFFGATINKLKDEKIDIRYLSINKSIKLDLKKDETINELMMFTVFAWNNSKIVKQPFVYKRNNCIPLTDDKNYTIIEGFTGVQSGALVFLVDEGAFFANNTVYSGNRVKFVGVVDKIYDDGKYLRVSFLDDLIEKVHEFLKPLLDNE